MRPLTSCMTSVSVRPLHLCHAVVAAAGLDRRANRSNKVQSTGLRSGGLLMPHMLLAYVLCLLCRNSLINQSTMLILNFIVGAAWGDTLRAGRQETHRDVATGMHHLTMSQECLASRHVLNTGPQLTILPVRQISAPCSNHQCSSSNDYPLEHGMSPLLGRATSKPWLVMHVHHFDGDT